MAKTFEQLFGRTPMTFEDLVDELQRASWPAEAILNPGDFLALALGGVPLSRDTETGLPYFLVAGTKVRPKAPRPGLVDLTDWRPRQLVLATFADS